MGVALETQAVGPADGITSTLAGMSREQLYEVMAQMKALIQQNPGQARQIMVQNPQLTKALFQVLPNPLCFRKAPRFSVSAPGQSRVVSATLPRKSAASAFFGLRCSCNTTAFNQHVSNPCSFGLQCKSAAGRMIDFIGHVRDRVQHLQHTACPFPSQAQIVLGMVPTPPPADGPHANGGIGGGPPPYMQSEYAPAYQPPPQVSLTGHHATRTVREMTETRHPITP